MMYKLLNAQIIPDMPNITHLDNLPQELEKLSCRSNKIISIGAKSMSPKLNFLDCSYNNISNLDNLPNTLTYLDCKKNKIKIINNIPPNIKYFIS